jgi:hypothetical protein
VKQINTFETCIQSIIALEPCYGLEGGNATRIYTRQGEILEDKRTLTTLLKRLLKAYGYDLSELRKHYGRYLGCGQGVPLPISRNLVLVQLKMRQPLVDSDSASGYVSVNDIVRISEEAGAKGETPVKCRLTLSGGLSLPCCFTRSFVEKRLNMGRLALDHYRYLHDNTGPALPPELVVAERTGGGPDLYEKINTISSFLYQLLADVRV